MNSENEGIPNPNVMFEMGYAHAKLGPSRFVAVFNIALGSLENLPFNIRHRRFPISYCLADEASPEERATVKTQLVSALATALRAIIESHDVPEVVPETRMPHTSSLSIYYDESEPILSYYSGSELENIFVPPGAKMFLRLIPKLNLQEFSNEECEMLARDGGLAPMSRRRDGFGRTATRNVYGAITWLQEGGTKNVLTLTQLFRNRELWGVDATMIKLEHCQEHGEVDFGFIPCSALEQEFCFTLRNYLDFFEKNFPDAFPVHFIAGLTGVADYRMAARFHFERFAGHFVEDSVVFDGEIRRGSGRN